MPYQPYQAPTAPTRIGYQSSSDPRKLAENQRAVVQSTGDNLMTNDEQLANQYAQQASGVENYLDPIESNLAAGNGGYNSGEANQIQLSDADKSQIQYSPQDVQGIVNKAGITAGQQTAASVGGAERAAAAAGGSPAALATYRARAAQQGAVNTADAMTNARVAAKGAQSGAAATAQQLQSAGGQAVGNARLGQQGQGLGYYGGLQQEKNANALSEQGLQQGAYGTQTSGTNDAANIGLKASQTPTTTDKIIGAASGALKAFALADGTSGYLDDGQDAVVGENGMEAVINNAPAAVQRGASDPVRSDTTFMANGDYGGETDNPSSPWMSQAPGLPPAAGQTPGSTNGDYGGETATPATAGTPNVKQPNFLQRYLANARQKQQQQQPSSGGEQWNKTTPYQQVGGAIGTGIGMLAEALADGQPPQQSPADYRRQADAALVRERRNEGPGKGGAQYSDHDTLTSMANTADAPKGGWGSDMEGPGKAPIRSPYRVVAGPGRGGYKADGDSGQPWWKDLVTHEAEGMLHNISPEIFAADGQDGVIDEAPAFRVDPINPSDIREGAQANPNVPQAHLERRLAERPLSGMMDSRLDEARYRFDRAGGPSRLSQVNGSGPGRGGFGTTRFPLTKPAPPVPAPHVPGNPYDPLAPAAPPHGKMPTISRPWPISGVMTAAADGQDGGGIGNYMADGASCMDADGDNENGPSTDQGVSMQADGRNGMQVGRAQVFTKPTMVHLNRADSVVPLTYRAKAKVRPSSALPAMMDRGASGGVRNAA